MQKQGVKRSLKVRDLCFLEAVSERCMRSRIARGDIPKPYKSGNCLRWDPAEYERWRKEKTESL